MRRYASSAPRSIAEPGLGLEKLPYDAERDLTLISNVVRVYNVLAVNPSLPVRTVPELIAYAKQVRGSW